MTNIQLDFTGRIFILTCLRDGLEGVLPRRQLHFSVLFNKPVCTTQILASTAAVHSLGVQQRLIVAVLMRIVILQQFVLGMSFVIII